MPRAFTQIVLSVVALLCTLVDAPLTRAGVPGPIPQWIWTSTLPSAGERAYFRHAFTIDGKVRRAEAYLLADDHGKLWLNGKQVASADDPHLVRPVDVTVLVGQGHNVLAIECANDRGPAGVLARLDVTLEGGTIRQIVTDPTWHASGETSENWQLVAEHDAWPGAESLGLVGVQPWGDPIGNVDDYNQWKKALGAGAVTGAASLGVMAGFEVELVRSALPGEGSWVSCAFDSAGRLTIAREDRGLIRIALPSSSTAQPKPPEVLDETLLECRGLLYVGDALYANANNSKGLYRLRSTDGSARFSDVKLLRAVPGGVGHGRNDLVRGPDGLLYLMFGNDTLQPTDYKPDGSPYAHFAHDRLLHASWNDQLFNARTKPPAGHVVRTDLDGSRWDVFAAGMRNPFGIDFKPDGELFTYDADMEWDLGAPWYRPTRITHLVSGADYGWRQGVDKWPAWYPDSVPSTLDIGKGSPTAVKFPTRAAFPKRFQNALFVLDWAYGRILAIHLIPRGASYTAIADLVVEGRPLNVTDLDVGPDGAVYFITGGRGTQSAVYRLRYAATAHLVQDDSAIADADAAKAREIRHKLETFHATRSADAVTTAWTYLRSSDAWLQNAARVAIEHQPVAEWGERALAEEQPDAALQALIALTRTADPSWQGRVLERLAKFDGPNMTARRQIALLRGYQLAILRLGPLDGTARTRLAEHLAPWFPTAHYETDQLLCELLVELQSPDFLPKGLTALEHAVTQEQKLFYLLMLRNVKQGWTLEGRQQYLRALADGNTFRGGQTVPQVLKLIRADYEAGLQPQERSKLQAELASLDPKPEPPAPTFAGRTEKHLWTLAELDAKVATASEAAHFEQGRMLFAAAQCSRCHRMGDQGETLGPDLTSAARRYTRHDMLQSIVEPSKVVDDKFRQTTFVLDDGRIVTGRVVAAQKGRLTVNTNMLVPKELVEIDESHIHERQVSPLSPMPEHLLDVLTAEEISELITYVQASGDRRHPAYSARK